MKVKGVEMLPGEVYSCYAPSLLGKSPLGFTFNALIDIIKRSALSLPQFSKATRVITQVFKGVSPVINAETLFVCHYSH